MFYLSAQGALIERGCKVLTNKQALQAYTEIVEAYASNEPLPTTSVNLFVESIKDLQVRDYLLGHAPSTFGAQGAIEFVTSILPLVDEGARAPFYTVLSAFYYEAGDSELAFVSLVQAQLLDPQYALAKLFERVYKAGWPATALAQMRVELHPKVAETFEVETELEFA
jgi:hypothetical protein